MLTNSNSSSRTFINIKEGKFVTKKGDEAHSNDTLQDVLISKMEFVAKDYQGKPYEALKVVFKGIDDNDYILEIRTESSYFRSFINLVRNADLSQPVTVKVRQYMDDGKQKRVIFITQNDESLKWYSTSANRKDVPQVKETIYKGQKMIDDTEVIEYWKKWVNSLYFSTPTSQNTYPTAPKQQEQQDTADDDLPF